MKKGTHKMYKVFDKAANEILCIKLNQIGLEMSSIKWIAN